jgi:hypothetical protein
MKTLQEMVFLGEIVLQSQIAQCAAESLKTSRDNFDHIGVWGSIQSILVAAGNVSKILWPQYKKHKSRGEELRRLLNIENDNILSNRSFRNHFEHYDDRVEEWFSQRPPAVYTDLSMNPSLRGVSSANDHRGYNAFNDTLIFRGESLDLKELLGALEAILESSRPFVPPWVFRKDSSQPK